MKKNHLSTGEFARLCKTTKETLFHYDRENLLKPKYISENGYRYYGMEQFFDFDMIAMLKETGSSLKEIKVFAKNTDGEDFMALLEAKLLVVRKERERLAQRETMLKRISACTREALDFPYDQFIVQEHKEERLEVVATKTVDSESTPEFIERLSEYIGFYEKEKRLPGYPFGVIVTLEDLLEERYKERYFFSYATRSTPRALLHVKPEGRYAVLAHKGTVETHLQAFAGLARQIANAGFSQVGNAYIYDMMSYVLHGTYGSYAAKYCIHIE